MLILTSIPYPRSVVVGSAKKKASWSEPGPLLRCIYRRSIRRKAEGILPAVIETVDAIEHATYADGVFARGLGKVSMIVTVLLGADWCSELAYSGVTVG